MSHTFDVLNPSILLGQLSVDEKLRATAEHGFTAVELWWPFPDAEPSVAEQDAVLSALQASGLELVSLNLYEGGMPEGHRGLVSLADREGELEASIRIARRLLAETGCLNLNVLHGNLTDAEPEQVQRERAAHRIARIADDVGTSGVRVLIEQLANVESYGIRTVEQLRSTLARVRELTTGGTVMIQFDFFHLALAGADLEQLLAGHIADIGHIQVADMPQRGGPGTGTLPIEHLLATIERLGYSGRIALEYSHYDSDPFEWMATWPPD